MEMRRRTLASFLLIALFALVAAGGPLLAAPGHEEGTEQAHEHEPADGRAGEAGGDRPYDVELETHPSPEEIVPDGEMTEMVLTVRKNGEVAEDVQLSYRLYAPPRTFWFGTDFPIVEGSQLLSGTVQAADGSHAVSMILPIRGTYGLKTTVRGPDGVTHEELSFSVSENPRDVLNLSVFLVVLLLLGAVAGYFLSGRTSASTPPVWGLFVAGIVGVSLFLVPTTVRAHGEGSWDPHELEERMGVEKIRPKADFEVRTFPTPVTVGEMLNVDYEVTVDGNGGRTHADHGHGHESGSGKESDVLVESIFVHSGGGMEMVRQSSRFSGGHGSLDVQLFEGAAHYLVSRFYRPIERYAGGDGHDHAHEESSGERSKETDEEKTGEHAHDQEENHDEEEAGEDEDHEAASVPWEAEMLHHLPQGEYQVHFEESGDSAMKWLVVPDDAGDPSAIAREGMADCEDVDPGSTVRADGRCYNLTLNEDGTTYELAVENGGDYRVFTQHLPREFNLTVERDGDVIDPLRKFIPGKGEYLGRSVERIEVRPVQPPFDDIFKVIVTFLAVIGLGYYAGSRGSAWIGRS